MTENLSKENLVSFAKNSREEYESLLKQFVEIPTVSSDPKHLPDIKRGADFAVKLVKSFGGKAKIYKTDKGNPVVHAKFETGKNHPTVTVYNHLDVQPASMETEPWKHEPFVMKKDGDRYLGRGTTDDKGPALAAFFGAKAALDAGVKLNINFLWEMEEEIGSPNFEKIIKENAANLKTDSIVVSDTIWVSKTRPANPSSLRGMMGFTLTLETAETDQHSGNVGGAARNPLGELMSLVAEIYDAKTGEVKIPGFYDDVAPLTEQEIKEFANSGFTASGFKKDYGFKSIRVKTAEEIMKRIWSQPTFEIHGVTGGYTGPGVKAIVPPRGEVKASCRLVANQNPKKIFEKIKAFVKEKNADVKVHAESFLPPYKGKTTGRLPEAVQKATEFAFGKKPVFIGGAGSIGAIETMERVLKCPVVFLGLSLPEHGYHAPNENFDWQQASGGIVAFAKYFELVSNFSK